MQKEARPGGRRRHRLRRGKFRRGGAQLRVNERDSWYHDGRQRSRAQQRGRRAAFKLVLSIIDGFDVLLQQQAGKCKYQ